MASRSDIARFLRAAVKTGLRTQNVQARTATAPAGRNDMASNGVATLQRIKASLSKRKTR